MQLTCPSGEVITGTLCSDGTVYEADIDDGTYPTHAKFYYDNDVPIGLFVRTTNMTFDLGEVYSINELQGNHLNGFIIGFFYYESSSSSITKLGFIVDYVDACMPNLSSPYLAVKNKETTKIMYNQSALADYTAACSDRLMTVTQDGTDQPIDDSGFSVTDYVLSYTPGNDNTSAAGRKNTYNVSFSSKVIGDVTILLYVDSYNKMENAIQEFTDSQIINQQIDGGARLQRNLLDYNDDDELNWQNSRDFCQNHMTGDLVVITDDQTSDLVKRLTRRPYGKNQTGWAHLGLTKQAADSDPAWIDGSSFLPNIDVPADLEASDYCVGINAEGWFGNDCAQDAPALCESTGFAFSREFQTAREWQAFIKTYIIEYEFNNSGNQVEMVSSDCIQMEIFQQTYTVSIDCTDPTAVGVYKITVTTTIENVPTLPSSINPFFNYFMVYIWPSCIELSLSQTEAIYIAESNEESSLAYIDEDLPYYSIEFGTTLSDCSSGSPQDFPTDLLQEVEAFIIYEAEFVSYESSPCATASQQITEIPSFFDSEEMKIYPESINLEVDSGSYILLFTPYVPFDFANFTPTPVEVTFNIFYDPLGDNCPTEEAIVEEEEEEVITDVTLDENIQEYILPENLAPFWVFSADETQITHDMSNSDFLLWSLFPLDYVEDPDGDELTITAELGQASFILSYDSDKIHFVHSELAEFLSAFELVSGGEAESLVSIELTATDPSEAEATTYINLSFIAPEAVEEEGESTSTDGAEENSEETEETQENDDSGDSTTSNTDDSVDNPNSNNGQSSGSSSGAASSNGNFDGPGWNSGISIDDFDFEQEEEEEEEIIIPKARFSNIDSRGKVLISFNTDMNFPENFEELILSKKKQKKPSTTRQLSNEIISVEVVMAQDQTQENVDFDWDIQMLSLSELEIQMYFNNALAVSAQSEVDQVQIKFNDPLYFSSKDIPLEIDEIKNSLPSQMPFNCTTCDAIQSTAENIQKTTMAAGGATAGTSFLLGASANLLFGLINTVQIYVHFPLFDLSFPPNVFSIMKVFIGIAQLDLVTKDEMWLDTFNYEPIHGMDPYNPRFELLKYESKSVIYNLGDLSLIQFYVFISAILIGIYYFLSKTDRFQCVTKRKGKFEKKLNEQKIDLMYNWPIRFLFEAFLELSIASLIKIYDNELSVASPADLFDSVLAIFYFIMTFIYPFYFMAYFTYNSTKLQEDKHFYKKYETAFQATRVEKLSGIYFNGIFMIRRICFVLNCVCLNGMFFTFQLLSSCIINVWYILYLIVHKPFKDTKDFKVELFSEFCVLMFLYTMLTFTEFVPEPTMRYEIGNISLGIFFLNILGGLVVLLRQQVQSIKESCVKFKEKCCGKKVEKDVKQKYVQANPKSGVEKVEFFPGSQHKKYPGKSIAELIQIEEESKSESYSEDNSSYVSTPKIQGLAQILEEDSSQFSSVFPSNVSIQDGELLSAKSEVQVVDQQTSEDLENLEDSEVSQIFEIMPEFDIQEENKNNFEEQIKIQQVEHEHIKNELIKMTSFGTDSCSEEQRSSDEDSYNPYKAAIDNAIFQEEQDTYRQDSQESIQKPSQILDKINHIFEVNNLSSEKAETYNRIQSKAKGSISYAKQFKQPTALSRPAQRPQQVNVKKIETKYNALQQDFKKILSQIPKKPIDPTEEPIMPGVYGNFPTLKAMMNEDKKPTPEMDKPKKMNKFEQQAQFEMDEIKKKVALDMQRKFGTQNLKETRTQQGKKL